MTKDEDDFRLRPRKPRSTGHRDDTAWAVLFKAVVHYARASSARRRASRGQFQQRRTRPYSQRCSVRAIYSPNTVKGQWRAHGRYLARDSAMGEIKTTEAGFDQETDAVDIAYRLEQWQRSGDERLWKLIVSPEFGEKIDLKGLARELLQRMELDLRTSLQWVAVCHYNTEHPHIHIALRGVDSDGKPLRLERDYVKHGIREIASVLCTNHLGYRSERDAEAAQEREVHEHRFTSLDRVIRNRAVEMRPDATHFEVVAKAPAALDHTKTTRLENHVTLRLMLLETMGLASRTSSGNWLIKSDFEEVLRSMQRIRDRQKTLAAHGAAVSDDRLPVSLLQFRDLKRVEGRILVHGEEENGRNYLMLESTDARIHHLYYTREIEEARAQGLMKTNSFVRLRKIIVDAKPLLEIDDLGDAEAILRNRKHFRDSARRLSGVGALGTSHTWGGWLGRYDAVLSRAVDELASERNSKARARSQER